MMAHASHQIRDQRTLAQIDCDRILYSSAFRRLNGITQVTSPDGTAVVHDRLLHSLKVAQIARSLAESLRVAYPKLCKAVDPDVCYAAGLAHDLGHPPFGHAGEMELQRILNGTRNKRHKATGPLCPDGFEGNAQSFRIVCRTSARKTDEWESRLGMHLCLRTLAAIAKYPWRREQHPPSMPYLVDKWSAYDTEAEELKAACEAAEADGLWFDGRSLEAQIMDHADDITYAVGDVEDFYRVGLIDFEALRDRKPSLIPELDVALANPKRYPDLAPREPFGEFYGYVRQRLVAWAKKRNDPRMSAHRVPDLIRSGFHMLGEELPLPLIPYDGSSAGKMAMHEYASRLIVRFMEGCTVDSDKGLVVSPGVQIEIEILKKLARYYTYDRPSIRVQQRGQVAVLRDCFFLFYDMCSAYFQAGGGGRDTHFSIPGRLYEYCQIALEERNESDYTTMPSGGVAHTTVTRAAMARAVCDYLCTLTDHSVLAIGEALREGRGDILSHLGSL